MKRSIKNFAATMIIGGIFFIPVFCSADTGENQSDEKPNVEIKTEKVVITQAEVEAIEEIKKWVEVSHKKTPKRQFRQDQMIVMNVINSIENSATATLK